MHHIFLSYTTIGLGQKGSCCLNEKQDNNMAPDFSKKAACLFSR